MKYPIILFALLLIGGCNTKPSTEQEGHQIHDHSASEKVEEVKKPLSPRTMAMANIGDNHVHIDYGSPSKRGRVIFGGLVGFGNVWATGAHSATNINFSKDVVVNGVTIPAGKYGLFTIPNESAWTIIISKDWDMHLADDYSEANDLVRIQAPVETLTEVQESLTFEVLPADTNQGQVTISWDMIKVGFQIKNK
jgi:hypothetical protein